MRSYLIVGLLLVFVSSGSSAGGKSNPASGVSLTHTEIAQDLFRHHPAPTETAEDPLPQPDEAGTKSPTLAVVYSLLLPGMGELYAGDYSTGKYFTIAEAALVITAVSLDRYGNWLKDDARQYAALHAHTEPNGKDDQYFSVIGDYQTVYQYNEAVLRNRDPEKVYDPNSSYYWSWDSPGDREQYRQLRVSSDERFNDAKFVVAAIGVNHIVSAIDAARLAIRHNRSVGESRLIDIHADVIGGVAHPQGIRVTLSKSF